MTPFLVRFCAPPLEHGGAFLTILAWDSRLSTNPLSVTVLTVAADGFGGQGVSQFSHKKFDKRQVPYGENLGKIIITLDDGVDLPNGPKLNARDGQDTLTITIVGNGKGT